MDQEKLVEESMGKAGSQKTHQRRLKKETKELNRLKANIQVGKTWEEYCEEEVDYCWQIWREAIRLSVCRI